jgi:hypothetical protein
MRPLLPGLIAAAGVLVLGGPSVAQIPDTAVADTTARDTVDYSELFLRGQEEGRRRVPVLPRLGARSLMPTLGRIVFDRDTIEWHGAETVADLLTKVPGVYVWRGGWVGRPEMINFQGRAATSVEYLLDGVPYLALGPDSLAVDPSLFPLSFLERMDVERLPGLLRVHLFTRRHDRAPPRTRVSVASGDFDIARYQASLEKRLSSGLGYVVAAEHLGVPLNAEEPGAYSNTQGWVQLSYVGPAGWAANLQAFRSGPNRDDIFGGAGGGDTLSAGLDGRRTDLHASFSRGPTGPGPGTRLSAVLAYSSWREDTTGLALGPVPPHQHLRLVDQSVLQAGLLAAARRSRATLEAAAWHRSRWTPLEARVSAAATPIPTMSAQVEGVYQRHDGERASAWLTARGGLELPLGLRVGGMIRSGSIVHAPVLASDSAVRGVDWAVQVGLERPRLAFEASYWRAEAIVPRGFTLFRTIPAIQGSRPTRWVTLSGRIAPRQWLILDGWYSDPIGAAVEGVPPTHSVINASIQSKFLRTFRSGIFALKLQGTMENWGTGVIGRDPAGNPVVLPGATLFRGLIQLRIGDFTAYYDRVNMRATRVGYVPGLPQLPFASTFGVRWEFSN